MTQIMQGKRWRAPIARPTSPNHNNISSFIPRRRRHFSTPKSPVKIVTTISLTTGWSSTSPSSTCHDLRRIRSTAAVSILCASPHIVCILESIMLALHNVSICGGNLRIALFLAEYCLLLLMCLMLCPQR